MRKLIALVLLMFCFSCGQSGGYQDEPAPAPSPGPGPSPGPSGDAFGDIQPLLQKFCSECHSDAVFIATEKGFLASKAPTRVSNKSMPPNFSKTYSQWKDSDRQRIMAYVQSKQLGK